MRTEKKKLSGSIAAKMVAFILLGLATLISVLLLYMSLYLAGNDAYSGSREGVTREMLRPIASEDYRYLSMRFEYSEMDEIELYCKERGIALIVEQEGEEENEEVVRLMDQTEEDYLYHFIFYYSFYEEIEVTSQSYMTVKTEDAEKTSSDVPQIVDEPSSYMEVQPDDTLTESVLTNYVMRIYVDPDTTGTAYREKILLADTLYEWRYAIIAMMCGGLLICISCFLFLMCAAGHRNGREEIVSSVMCGVPLEILVVAIGVITFGMYLFMDMIGGGSDLAVVIMIAAAAVIEAVMLTLFCMEIAIRMKQGVGLRNTIIYRIFALFGRMIRSLYGALMSLPLVWKTMGVYLGISLLELIVASRIHAFYYYPTARVIWGIEKVILFVILLYISLVCKKLQKGSEALAKGDLNHKLDPSHLILDFKEHAENLNSIGEGISKAVEDRMHSERLKTELITNVSHDLKTPLTSIINYADLLGSEELEREQITEYSEVLLRQSKRLKKLLEDLLEASKATTGNLEVNLQPCAISVILSQAVGEYEPRFAEKDLELQVKQPEEDITIQADGRHLWRVFDNLLNNIYKYAQDHSRVYINVEQQGPKVQIIFRNMSKYALNISPQELEERFVRGDSSRHMEGNGLGLSIAKSLTELQNGTLAITVDGDLFKVNIEFPVV